MNALKPVALLVAVLVAAQVTGRDFFDRLAVALVVLLVVAWAWSRLSLRGVALVRETATDRAQVGQTLRETLRVANRGRLAKLWLEVRDYSTLPGHAAGRVAHVRGRRDVRWEVATPCHRRGRFRIGPLAVRSGDPFGFFPRTLRVPGSHELVVYPATVDVSGFALPAGNLTGGATRRGRTPFVTPSVAGLREYAPGDALNRISWTHTARLGRMMVKEFDFDPTADVWIVLDLDRAHHRPAVRPHPSGAAAPAGLPAWLDSTEEYAVTVAASLAARLLDEGREVGLVASAGHHEVITAERSDRQYVKILEALAVIRADGARPLAEVLAAEARRFTRQSALVVVTPSTDEAWVQGLVEIAGRRVRAVAVVVEAETFGPAESSLLVVGGLLAAGVPTHLLKYGDGIGAALTSVPGASGAAFAGARRD